MAPATLGPTRGRRNRAARWPVDRPCAARAGAAGRHARPVRVPRRPHDQRVSRDLDQSRTRCGDRTVVGLRGAGDIRNRCGGAHRRRAGIRERRIALTINSSTVVVRQPALFTIVMAVAAACRIAGTLAWIQGAEATGVAGWWLAFLVLTVAAERLELSRLLSPPRSSQLTCAIAVALIITGAARGEFAGEAAPFSGAGLLASTAWLVSHDIALRTIRLSGLPRFSAACLLAGYSWLGAAGLLLLVSPPGTTAFSYGAAVHAITIGFILSMIFGHAPIILPAVTGLRIRYSAAAYVPVFLLHLSVLLRIAADLLEHTELRTISGPATIIALASYAATLIIASRNAASRKQ